MGKIPHSLQNGDFLQLSNLTEGFSGDDLRILVQDARFQAVKDLKQATHFQRSEDGRLLACSPGQAGAIELDFQVMLESNDERLHDVWLPDVSMSDFRAALRRTRPSVSQASLPQYIQFTAAAGQDGTM